MLLDVDWPSAGQWPVVMPSPQLRQVLSDWAVISNFHVCQRAGSPKLRDWLAGTEAGFPGWCTVLAVNLISMAAT